MNNNINNNEELFITRAEIEANPKIHLVDSDPDNNIELFCYDSCDENDEEIVKICRGIVLSGENIVLRGFPYTVEYTQKNNSAEIYELLNSNMCRIYDSFEGTLLRMFCFNNKWYLSTNRKLDANKSKWSSKATFGELFKKAIEYEIVVNPKFCDAIVHADPENSMCLMSKFLNMLNPSRQYMFLLLCDMENRIVCRYDHPKFLHVGTFINGGSQLSLDHDVSLGLDSPKQHLFDSIEQMYEYINTLDYNLLQGVIVFTPGNKQYKIFNQTYLDLYQVRGNEASVKFRYLQIRNDAEKKEQLRALYPEWCSTFDFYDKCILNICGTILQGYINRYIRKIFTTLPLEQFIVMSEVHKWHKLDQENNKVNLSIVLLTLNLQKPTTINRMIKKFIAENK